MRRAVWTFALLFLFLTIPAVSQDAVPADGKLRFAAAQHEIIAILINEGQYDRILDEFARILQLGFSGPEEELLVKETWSIAKALMEARKFELAHRVIDRALETTELADSEFALMMLKGKVYRQDGKLTEALDVYRKAQSLQE